MWFLGVGLICVGLGDCLVDLLGSVNGVRYVCKIGR